MVEVLVDEAGEGEGELAEVGVVVGEAIALCYGCNTKSTRYSSYSGNVPELHILLRVELLTLFTSGLPSCCVPHLS